VGPGTEPNVSTEAVFSAGGFFMHDTPDQSHWHEPKAGENAGFRHLQAQAAAYDVFMEAEGVPVYRGIGVRRVQDLPMTPWKRLGGRGSYIQLYGTEGLWGSYVVEMSRRRRPQCGAHLYEKVVLVVEVAVPPKSGRKARTSGTCSSGRRARCSPSRSMPFTGSSMRRARRRCCCAEPPPPM